MPYGPSCIRGDCCQKMHLIGEEVRYIPEVEVENDHDILGRIVTHQRQITRVGSSMTVA